MKGISKIALAAATGALATWLLDPEQGRRRRAMLRERTDQLNQELARLLGTRAKGGIDVRKALHIAVAPGELYEFWSNFQNFPKFMRNVRSVRRNAEADSWHWEVAGPLGATMQWDARVTRSIPGRLISWTTEPGSQVQHAGTVRFQPEDGGTRLEVKMSYRPPAGAAGHVVASLFGADPRAELEEDLERLKSLFESGAAVKPSSTPAA